MKRETYELHLYLFLSLDPNVIILDDNYDSMYIRLLIQADKLFWNKIQGSQNAQLNGLEDANDYGKHFGFKIY